MKLDKQYFINKTKADVLDPAFKQYIQRCKESEQYRQTNKMYYDNLVHGQRVVVHLNSSYDALAVYLESFGSQTYMYDVPLKDYKEQNKSPKEVKTTTTTTSTTAKPKRKRVTKTTK